MKIKNALRPNDEQIEDFSKGDVDKPISMINLLKFKETAVYKDRRETNITGQDRTGQEAWAIYSQACQNIHLKKVGGEGNFSGVVSQLMIGEIEELWDWVVIVKYPIRKAMLEMIIDKDYLESEKHRSLGLKGQLNIETK